MSKLSLPVFLQKYQGCTRCELHKTRQNIVFARGVIPSDIVFCGEAPGKSEDDLAEPFIGVAGKLLDQIIAESVPTNIVYSLCNMICCLPTRQDGEISQPDYDHVMACSERLQDFVELANPKLIVCVGGVAWDYLNPEWKDRIRFHREIPVVEITHPAAILRQKEISRPFAIRKCVVTISEAIREHLK